MKEASERWSYRDLHIRALGRAPWGSVLLLLYPGVGPTKGIQAILAAPDVFPCVAEQRCQ